jgi:hypothetical protein
MVTAIRELYVGRTVSRATAKTAEQCAGADGVIATRFPAAQHGRYVLLACQLSAKKRH